MKNLIVLIFIFTLTLVQAQSLPIDFESLTTSDFTDFDGGTASVIANPQMSGTNTSATVAQIVRDGGEVWAGSKIQLDNNLDFSTSSVISMKVFTTAPIGTTVKFKLEGSGDTELDTYTTTSNEWETLSWNFAGQPANFNFVVFMFDFGNTGDGSVTSTFLFDDIEQIYGGEQIDLPVNFEGSAVDYTTTDFGGNISSLVVDPINPNNHVIQAIKTDESATWAGTTIGTPAGFATNIPLTLMDSKMYVKVWSPEANTPIRLKVENSNDPTQTCETEVNTTLGGEWEVLEFDFTNEALGTQSLSVGLSMGWTYNMASIFFNFGTEGSAAGEKTYYFDNVSFSEILSKIENNLISKEINVTPNPASNEWQISLIEQNIISVDIFDLQGKLLHSVMNNNSSIRIDASDFASGVYLARITTDLGIGGVKLVRK